MKLCVSLNPENFNEYLKLAKNYNFVELRLDLFDFTNNELKQLLNLKSKFIVSFIDNKTNDNIKIQKLKQAVKLGADIIDIDVNINNKNIKELKQFADLNNCKTIISYHNFNNTPAFSELIQIVSKIKQFNPDYIKIVCFAKNNYDNNNILKLYNYSKNIIAFNMGKLGKISRIKALKSEAPHIYVSVNDKDKTAPGQLTYSEAKKYI